MTVEMISPQPYKLCFSCDYCGTPFKYQKALISHYQKNHQVKVGCDYKCEAQSCNYIGQNQKNLTAHIKKQHEKKTLQHCKECGLVIYGDNKIEKHNITFHKATTCRICDQVFGGKRGEMKHYRNKHSRNNDAPRPDELEKPPPCNLCGAQYSWKSGLRGHMKRVHKALNFSEAGGEELAKDVTTEDGVEGTAVMLPCLVMVPIEMGSK